MIHPPENLRLPPMVPGEFDEEENVEDLALIAALESGADLSKFVFPDVPIEDMLEPILEPEPVGKGFGQPRGRRKNKARQIRNLKRKRKYRKPVRGGTRRPTFAKDHPLVVKHAGPGNHPSGSPQSVHGSGAPRIWSAPDDEDSTLQDHLAMVSDMGGRTEGAVFDHGRSFTPPTPESNLALMSQYSVDPGELRGCFRNASQPVLNSNSPLTYVEGYAMASTVPFPVHHAWLVTSDGQVIDPTWWGQKLASGSTIDPGAEYFGIPFTGKFIQDRALYTEKWGVFQGGKDDRELFEEGGLDDAISRDFGS